MHPTTVYRTVFGGHFTLSLVASYFIVIIITIIGMFMSIDIHFELHI